MVGTMGMVLLKRRIKLILGIVFFLALAASITANFAQGAVFVRQRVKLGTAQTLHAAELKQLREAHKSTLDALRQQHRAELREAKQHAAELRKQLRDRHALRKRLVDAGYERRPGKKEWRAFLWELRRPRQRAPNLAERGQLARQAAKLFADFERCIFDMQHAAKAE